MFSFDKADYIIGRFFLESDSRYELEEAVKIISTEESIGIESIAFDSTIKIYPGITGLDKKIVDRCSAQYKIIEHYNKNSGLVDIYFPISNIEQQYGTINILLSTILGDLYGLEVVDKLFLEDIIWPDNFLSNFSGPKFGMENIVSITNAETPLFGAIIKPNIGLQPRELGELVYQLAIGGVNFIKDDELLSSTKNSPIFERLKYAMDGIYRASKITNNQCLFAINITADGKNTYRLAKEVVKRGANCLMINVFAAGFDTLKEIAEDKSISVPIHTHRCMHDFFTSRTDYGVHPSIFAELARMCGADFFHIGTLSGKTEPKMAQIKKTYKALTTSNCKYKKTIPVSSRASILSLDKTHNILNTKDLMILSCGAIYKNELPITASAKVMTQGIDYYFRNKDKRSEEYFKTLEYLTKLYNS